MATISPDIGIHFDRMSWPKLRRIYRGWPRGMYAGSRSSDLLSRRSMTSQAGTIGRGHVKEKHHNVSHTIKKKLTDMRIISSPQLSEAEANDQDPLAKTLRKIQNESMRYKHLNSKPWLDEGGNVVWSWQRLLAA
eukprot:Skav201635  [mRNA]  locus=scaffold3087:26084:27193:+ [translate_table: standard]